MSNEYAPGKRARTITRPMGSAEDGGSSLPTPGKRALTDRLSAPPHLAQGTRVTGIPVVDQGLACDDSETLDQPVPPECWLSALERARLLQALGDRAGRAHTNFATQCAAKRVEILCTRESGWGVPAWILFEIFTDTVIGTALKAAVALKRGASKAMAESVMRASAGIADDVGALVEIGARIDPTRVTGPLRAMASFGRFAIRDKVKHVPPRAVGKAEFLLALSAEADAFTQAAVETLPAGLDDDGLLLLVESFDRHEHAQAVYSAAIDDILARYDAAEIGYVGKSWDHNTAELYGSDYNRSGRLDVVRFSYRGRTRSALVETRHTMQRMDEADPGAPRAIDARTLPYAQWVRWLDDDLAGAASTIYEGRVKAAPMEVDVESVEVPPALMPFVSVWIAGGE